MSLQFETVSTERPLDERMLNRIQVNWKTLLELIALEGGLVAMLYARNCITKCQKQLIEGAGDNNQINNILLYIMSPKSVTDFNRFVDYLSETGHEHIVAMLLNQDAVK